MSTSDCIHLAAADAPGETSADVAVGDELGDELRAFARLNAQANRARRLAAGSARPTVLGRVS